MSETIPILPDIDSTNHPQWEASGFTTYHGPVLDTLVFFQLVVSVSRLLAKNWSTKVYASPLVDPFHPYFAGKKKGILACSRNPYPSSWRGHIPWIISIISPSDTWSTRNPFGASEELIRSFSFFSNILRMNSCRFCPWVWVKTLYPWWTPK